MKQIKVSAVVQHPNTAQMASFSTSQVDADLNYAITQYNAYHVGKFKILSYQFSLVPRWTFDFLIEVPDDYTYAFPLLRKLSKSLYHDRQWRQFSTVETRLFSVVNIEEFPGGVMGALTEETALPLSQEVTMARITFEIYGTEQIITSIKQLLAAGATAI